MFSNYSHVFVFVERSGDLQDRHVLTHPSPPRRPSDLGRRGPGGEAGGGGVRGAEAPPEPPARGGVAPPPRSSRQSVRAAQRAALTGQTRRSSPEASEDETSYASITTGTIMGLRLVLSFTKRPAERRTARWLASLSGVLSSAQTSLRAWRQG